VYGLATPFFLDGLCALLAFVLGIFLIEPPRTKIDSQESSWSQIYTIIKRTYNNKKVWRLIVFSALVSAMTINMTWFSQPYMQLVNLPIIYIGWFRCIMNASSGVVSLFIHQIEKFLTERVFMIAIVCWSIVCMLVLAFFPSLWLLPVFFLFQITRQGTRLISNDNLHILSDSSIRATIQSISSMAFRLVFAVW
jgi:hypothetical protein